MTDSGQQADDRSGATTLLVTGFEPFGGSGFNPSQVVIEALAGGAVRVPGVELCTALLPVDTEAIASVVESLWAEVEPDAVLHLGESGKADCLTLERVALNLLDFETPDNMGRKVVDVPIDPLGPAARFSTLPMRTIRDRLASKGVLSKLSLSAGAYLCNQTLYLSLGHAERRGGRPMGFVHVPSLPEQVAKGERSEPSMPGEVLIEQIGCLIGLAFCAESTDKPMDRC